MIITNIQRMSTEDGPGIRTTVFVKGCPLRCKWCHNPECMEKTATAAFSENWKHTSFFPEEAEAICTKLELDKKFYMATDGGVTISGGEPLLYPEFVSYIGSRLAEKEIPLAIDTCGLVPWSSFEQILPITDLFLYDLKASSRQLHQKLTGQGNEQIWDNLFRLCAAEKAIWIRIPAVIGANGSELEQLAERIPKEPCIERIEFLPYHKYGSTKYKKLKMEYPGNTFTAPEAGQLKNAIRILLKKGFPCYIKGEEQYDSESKVF